MARAPLFADVDAKVEVRNEARVHLWYEQRFGAPAEPCRSSRDAIDHFASTAVNTASRATMTSLGMRHVRTFHLTWDDPLPGLEHGEVEYALARAEWLHPADPAAGS